MATTFVLSDGTPLRWPPVCVRCANPDVVPQKLFGSSVDDFQILPFLMRVTENRMTLHYPMCRRHRWVSRIEKSLLVFATSVAVLAFVWLSNVISQDAVWSLWILGAMILICLFTLARIAEPVRVFAIRDGRFRLQIRNDIYARAFAAANAPHLERRDADVLIDHTTLSFRLGRAFARMFRRGR